MHVGAIYELTYRCRDIGYGVEEGHGTYIYRGLFDAWGKFEWEPLLKSGGPTIYLFEDEVVEAV